MAPKTQATSGKCRVRNYVDLDMIDDGRGLRLDIASPSTQAPRSNESKPRLLAMHHPRAQPAVSLAPVPIPSSIHECLMLPQHLVHFIRHETIFHFNSVTCIYQLHTRQLSTAVLQSTPVTIERLKDASLASPGTSVIDLSYHRGQPAIAAMCPLPQRQISLTCPTSGSKSALLDSVDFARGPWLTHTTGCPEA